MHPDLVDAIKNARISPDALLEHFNQGQIELNKNQYQASSDHFTAAIDEATNSLSTLLLSRALAYTNDGEHDRALADARKVMEITPASADGYLCAGDVYVVKANMEEALRVYRNGVTNANKEHPQYHSLETTLDHLYNNVILPTNAHLLERLGKRITNHVFSFLPLRDRVVCAATCHTWRTYLFSWEGMWHHLRFTSGISTQCLDSLFARIEKGDQVKTCTIIAKWDDFDLAPQVLERLVVRLKCRNLEALSKYFSLFFYIPQRKTYIVALMCRCWQLQCQNDPMDDTSFAHEHQNNEILGSNQRCTATVSTHSTSTRSMPWHHQPGFRFA